MKIKCSSTYELLIWYLKHNKSSMLQIREDSREPFGQQGNQRRLLRVPWTARSNLSVLKEINTEQSLEGLMLKLKLKLVYSGHLMWRTDSLEKPPMLGKIEGRRRRG